MSAAPASPAQAPSPAAPQAAAPAPPPAFRAYEPEVVAEGFGRAVGAICAYGDDLLAGLGDGSLLFFSAPTAGGGGGAGGGDAAGGGRGPWQVTRVEKGFFKKQVLHLQVVLEGASDDGAAGDSASDPGPALLSLTDDGAALHALPALAPLATAPRSGKAAALAWCGARRELAVASKRRVVTYRLTAPTAADAAATDAAATPPPAGRASPAGAAANAASPAAQAAGSSQAAASGGGGGGGSGGSTSGAWGFRELTEYALPEAAECLAWVGGSLIVGAL